MDFDAIFIDADNTLFDFDRTQHNAINDSLIHFRLPTDTSAIACYNRINRHCWDQHDAGHVPVQHINSMRWNRWAEEMGVASKIDADELADHYEMNLAQQCEKEEGAEELFDYLVSKYPVHIITNGFPAVQEHRWHKAGWADRLQGITISSVVGVKKPQPEIYSIAMAAVGVTDVSRCLMIGDDIKSDVQGPQAVGMKGCWYRRKGALNQTDIQPDFVVSHLTEIIDIV